MKKILSIVLSLCLVLSVFAVPVTAASSAKLTSSEMNIIKAYQQTLETKNLQYVNKYKYSGVSYKMLSIPNGSTAKILTPQYSKSYDSKQKLYTANLKGLLVISSKTKLSVSSISCGVYLKTKNKKTYAYNAVATTTKAIEVKNLTSSQKNEVKKYLSSKYGDKTANSLMNPSTAIGSINNPVPLNQKYTWSETKSFLDDQITGTFSMTVKSFKKVTLDELKEMGITAKDREDHEYAIVDILWEVQNAKITKVKGQGSAFLSVGWDPYIWGIKTSDKASIIGTMNYGFDGSLDDAIDEATDLRKITPGMTESFKAEGKVILDLYKNKTNFLVMQNEQIRNVDYDGSFIYFKLK
ncbi:hypothetical protein [Ruminiclostridium cellulolyticum]|uniref:Uncharacterized protein n=1 Tax=Ruminiclostridium cellulolyticum (strain ATCC 35319 / DSM 5812 / JCM 6584 / H10) TaxID=394503 RepID=B8I1J0_RUMCH|nr:hypothetical protein [Ruminiclostridium cellulolyticum]ACL77625.1 hypothetical protein Ccel_3336 [Ruminiclostridium cellulolyticum H10]